MLDGVDSGRSHDIMGVSMTIRWWIGLWWYQGEGDGNKSHFEVPYEMRHGREPLRRSSGSYEGSFEPILVMG
ncbi:hypothetical protein RJ640_006675 [Escallonia rubra]|uniref:Uncharacterized protein n=1 Tax=Escallonia rubra TaxID=112253 RepID=A0AA88UE25_9ASTE|nr:hypothetical protein RJ640_006675 [Escallonia rubra]